MNKIINTLAGSWMSCLALFSISALSPLSSANAQDWKFEASPYAWLAGVDGNVSARGHSAEFSKSFSDLLSDVNGGVMGRFEASNDGLILTTDLTYIDLGANKDIGPVDIKAEVKETILEIGGGYHIGDFCLGENSETMLSVDALGGARYFDADATIKGPFGRDPNTNISYWEPYIGPRLALAFDDQWSLGLRTDIGGFNLGYDPYFSWQLTTGVKYQYTKLLSFGLGYKFLNIYDINRKDASADLKMDGLILGMTFSF